ncbi:unnamed protein product [Moneuplotes crassus]|uniref:TLC domain-containing protein n=1 Tax=Euplotes crassus TaxID=5936 RepID=A0AAD2CZH0_EUPCR|nr:unnamed protein product [Moneuplotes crassus]
MASGVPPQIWVYIPNQTTLLNILLSALFWGIIQMVVAIVLFNSQTDHLEYSKRKPKKMSKFEVLDTKNRFTSLIHGIMCICFSYYDVTYIKLPYGSPNHPIQTLLITLSLGYFIYDLIAMAYYGVFDICLLIHHGITCCGYYLSLCFSASGSEIMAGVYVSEISNPFMHIWVICRNLGYKHTMLNSISQYLYILLYIYYRLFKGIYVVWNCFTCQNGNHPIIKALSVMLAIQSYFFIYKMANMCCNKLNSSRHANKKRGNSVSDSSEETTGKKEGIMCWAGCGNGVE